MMRAKSEISATLFSVIFLAYLHGERSCFEKGAALVAAKQYKEAGEVFRSGSETGDPACMDFLGWLYLEGKGVRQSDWIAYGHFREAAKMGSSQACRNLGDMYYGARSVEPSTAQAALWWSKAAELGAPRAAFSLATLLYTAAGPQRNREKALSLWQEAVANGHTPSAVALAFAKAEGEPARIDRTALQAGKVRDDDGAKALMCLADLARSGTLRSCIPIDFEPQAHNFCAVATTAHILKSAGISTTQFEIAGKLNPPIWGKGSDWGRMRRVAAGYGVNLEIMTFPVTEEGFKEGCKLLLSELNSGRPVVIDTLNEPGQRSAHTVLLTGHTEDLREFIIRDSAWLFPGIRVVEQDEFKRIWNSIGFLPTNRELKRACMILKPVLQPAQRAEQ